LNIDGICGSLECNTGAGVTTGGGDGEVGGTEWTEYTTGVDREEGKWWVLPDWGWERGW